MLYYIYIYMFPKLSVFSLFSSSPVIVLSIDFDYNSINEKYK